MKERFGCYRPGADFRSADVAYAGTGWANLGDKGFSAGGFHYDSTSACWIAEGGAQINVYGRYIAGSFRPPLTLHNGATLDLSAHAGAWSADGTPSPAQNAKITSTGLVSFASGATITVALGARTDILKIISSDAPYIATWSREPEGTVFVLDSASAKKYLIEKTAGGLKVARRPGFWVIVK